MQLYRGLTADNPGYLPNLATATGRLGRLRGELGGPHAADAVWQTVLDGLPLEARALLLLDRAQQSDDDDLAAAGWLADADSLAGNDRELAAAIRDEIRRRRHRVPAEFDAAWSTATGSLIPDWARVDPDLVDAVREWTNTATYSDEAAFLLAHLELLQPEADVAVHEGLLGEPEDEAARYLRLRAEAQTVGADAAYRHLVLSELAAEFVDADSARQRHLLFTRRAQLLDEQVVEAIRVSAAEDESFRQAAAASSLLTLAATEPFAFIDQLIDAIDNPDAFLEVLERVAKEGRAATLAEIAKYGLAMPTSRTGAAGCLFFLAVAAILDHDADTATQYVAAGRNADPDARDTWIDLAARIGARQPDVLTLIPMLTNTRSPEQETP